MSRQCIGYKDHECADDMSGRAPNAKRCGACNLTHSRLQNNNRRKPKNRAVYNRFVERRPTPEISVFRPLSQNDQTRLVLYRGWASGLNWVGSEAAKKEAARLTKLANAITPEGSPS